MAPSLEVLYEDSPVNLTNNNVSTKPISSTVSSYIPGRTVVESHVNYDYDDLKPSFPDKHWPPLEKVPYHDKGLLGEPSFKNLLANATDVFDYNPKIGTEINGIDLANLSDAAKNDLALLIATRGVVFFRNQKNFGIDAQRKLGAYYGTLHKHATTAVPKRGDLDDVHVVYTDEKSKEQRAMFAPTFLWHSDISYELQPPSYTSLKVLTGPPRGGGGDTLWSSQYAAYDALSAPNANLPRIADRCALLTHTSRRFQSPRPNSSERSHHHRTSAHQISPGNGLEILVFQPRLRDEDRGHPEG
jgi:sulfonate dioxygenase